VGFLGTATEGWRSAGAGPADTDAPDDGEVARDAAAGLIGGVVGLLDGGADAAAV
jgi:hypothetical protein